VADLPAGYYLIIDTIKNESGQGHGDAVSDFVVEIAGDKTFSPKATSVPTFDKTIDDAIGENGGGEAPGGDTHAHKYTEIVTKEASCTEDGEKTFVCNECGETYTEVIPASGHSVYEHYDGCSYKLKYSNNDSSKLYVDAHISSTNEQLKENHENVLELISPYANNTTWTLQGEGILAIDIDMPADGMLNNVYHWHNGESYRLEITDDKDMYEVQTSDSNGTPIIRLNKGINTIYFRLFSTTDYISGDMGFDLEPMIKKTSCSRCGKDFDDNAGLVLNDVFSILPTAYAAEDTSNEVIKAESDNDTAVNYGIGDSVPFRLTAVMPDSISAYETYKLVFHDSMTDGLTYNEGSLKVFVGDTEIHAENYTVTSDDGMKSFTVTINDAKVDPFNAAAGTEVSVKYTATLNDSAAFKNINNAYLEYSNNPNGEGTGTTVSDDVTAFTFELGFDKVDKDGNALAGAGFTLYKKTADGYVQFGDEVTGGTDFSFGGLAVGDYKLVESTTPDGYNTMEDLEFSVVADSMEDANGNAYVTGLKIVAQGGTLESNILEGWTADTDTGILSADIANYRGSELPSTGGMGTMMFYTAGGCIMAVVCFVLVKRKEQCAE